MDGNIKVVVPKKRVLQTVRESNKYVTLVVGTALFLDNMLLTIIVPIVPEYLYELQFAKEHSPALNLTNSTETMPERRHNFLIDKSFDVGMMLGSKAFVQLFTNPIVGPATLKFGYNTPMFFGYIIMFLSTLLFAFGIGYNILFLARALQGVGSACASVSGLGLLAARYTDDIERGKAMSLAMSGLAFGVVLGPPVGGILYQLWGKTIPFLIICCLILFGVCLQMSMINVKADGTKGNGKAPSLKSLLMDPYILITAGGLSIANIGFAFLDASLSIWMMDTMKSQSWELGVVFIPSNIFYWIGLAMFPALQEKVGRWLMSVIGLIFTSISLMLLPISENVLQLTFPIGVMGLANAMVECALLPELGFLVDLRHSSAYGNVYAIGDVALCLGFGLGPILSGLIMKEVGFAWMMLGCGFLCFSYAPVLTLLRNPRKKITLPKLQSANEEKLSEELMSGEPGGKMTAA